MRADQWELLRRAPPLHLRTWDQDILSEVMDESARHGHRMEVWHVNKTGQTAYATCVLCRLSAWRIEARLTRFEVGLLHPCAGSESAEHQKLRTRLDS